MVLGGPSLRGLCRSVRRSRFLSTFTHSLWWLLSCTRSELFRPSIWGSSGSLLLIALMFARLVTCLGRSSYLWVVVLLLSSGWGRMRRDVKFRSDSGEVGSPCRTPRYLHVLRKARHVVRAFVANPDWVLHWRISLVGALRGLCNTDAEKELIVKQGANGASSFVMVLPYA